MLLLNVSGAHAQELLALRRLMTSQSSLRNTPLKSRETDHRPDQMGAVETVQAVLSSAESVAAMSGVILAWLQLKRTARSDAPARITIVLTDGPSSVSVSSDNVGDAERVLHALAATGHLP